MSLLRNSRTLPLNTAMQLSPWLLVGSAIILGLAITFFAAKNAQLERENMTRVLLERSGALMWAMESGARAGMGMAGASYLQHMMEETARQPDINYIAIVTRDGNIVLHSDQARIDETLAAPDAMAGLSSGSGMHWRILRQKGQGRSFEAFKLFMPMPGFSEHMMHGRRHGGMMRRAGKHLFFREQKSGPAMREPLSGLERSQNPAEQSGSEYLIVVSLDMTPFENALNAGKNSIIFTAFLVGLLGVGGFISLFWAQSYKLSRRLLLDASAVADKVIDSLPLGLVILDRANKVREANEVAAALLDCPVKQLLGRGPLAIPGLDWTGIAARVESGEAVLEEEYALRLPDPGVPGGERSISVSVSAVTVLNDEGERLGLVFLMRDLREVKRLQKELRRSERLSTLGNMAARVAHEIRNPLSSIKGFATYLGSRRKDEEDGEAIRTMIGEVDRLNRVVSELLDFARPSSLDIAPVDVAEVLRRAVRLAESDASAGEVRMRLELPEAVGAIGPLLAAADPERITQALLNLFINAVQATPRGGCVTISASLPKADRVAITVSDSGCGMPDSVRTQIFNPYFTTKAAGTGLGLAIVAKIVEDHDGEITVQSVEGQGTVVTLLLPAAEETGQTHKPE